jgi:hypothetical protein
LPYFDGIARNWFLDLDIYKNGRNFK